VTVQSSKKLHRDTSPYHHHPLTGCKIVILVHSDSSMRWRSFLGQEFILTDISTNLGPTKHAIS